MKPKAFYALAALPILLTLFSWLLIKPMELRLPSAGSVGDASLRAASLGARDGSFSRAALQQVTPTTGMAGTPTAVQTDTRPPQERNPGLVAGGLLIVLIIMIGLLRYTRARQA